EHIIVFHLARLFGGAVLIASLYMFVARFFTAILDRRFAFALALIGSGFGGFALIAGVLTPDVLNAEIFPFLAIFANPHFPLAMAAMLWVVDVLITPTALSMRPRDWVLFISGALILALTQPYGLLVAGLVGSIWVVIEAIRTRRIPVQLSICLGLIIA